MSILQMQRISVLALQKHCNDILETLQRVGVVELRKIDSEDSVFYREDTKQLQTSYMRNSLTVRSAAEVLNSYIDYKRPLLSSLAGRKVLTKDEYTSRTQNYANALQAAFDVILSDKKITECKAHIISLKNRIEALKPWENLDVALTPSTSDYTCAFAVTIAEEFDYETLRLKIAQCDSESACFDMEIISSDENQTCVYVVCHKKYAEQLDSVLKKIGFVMPSLSTDSSVYDTIKELEREVSYAELSIFDYKERIKAQRDMYDDFRFFEDYFALKAQQYEQVDNILYSQHTFIMTGYVPKTDGEKLAHLLYRDYKAFTELSDAFEDDVPVVLHNNSLAEPVEGIVLSYSPPRRKEIDPTTVMALFYYIFFGMMFSDAGYGLIMTVGCGLGLKLFPAMELKLRKSFRMFFWCGISTLFWGLMFGSFFGDAVRVISNTFFGSTPPDIPGITTPVWFNPTEGAGPTKLLMFSFLLGIIHLFTGLLMQAANYVRNKKILYAVYDDLSWMLLVGGAVLMLLSTEMLSSMAGFMLPSNFVAIGGTMAIAGGLLILFCSARTKNPFKRFIKGAYNLYGATSYLSDILSYSRLLALGLATGVVAQVFNQLGAMFGGGVLGAIGFTVVFVIGHTLNIGINALGAYVHTNRLQFVEFFGKFYEGGGKEFKPFCINTRYYNIKEDI